MRDTEEMNAIYKDGAEKTLKFNARQIEEKNKLVAELEEKGKTQELSVREKSRLERTKDEITKLEENSKFRQQEIDAYKIAEEQKKKLAENTAEIVEKQSEKVTADIKEEMSVAIGKPLTEKDAISQATESKKDFSVVGTQPGTSAFDLANMEPQGQQPNTGQTDFIKLNEKLKEITKGKSEEETAKIREAFTKQVSKAIEAGGEKEKEFNESFLTGKLGVDQLLKKSGQIKEVPNAANERLKNRQADAEKLKTTAFDKEGKLDLNKINLPGMANFGFKPAQKVPKTSEAQPKPDENQSAAETARLNRSGTKPTEQPKTETSTVQQKDKDKQATLDDVVKSLDRLNIKMGELITKHETLMTKQISATSQNSSNILDRARPR